MKITRSLSWKVVLILVTASLLSALTVEVTVYTLTRHQSVDELNTYSQQTAERISHSLVYPLWNLNENEVEKAIALELEHHDVMAIVVRNYNGEFYQGKIKDTDGLTVPFIPTPQNEQTLRTQFFFARRPVVRHGETIGFVELASTDRYLREAQHMLLLSFLAQALILALIIMGIVFLSLNKIIIRPLIRLEQAARNLGTGDFTVRAEVTSDDEMGMLARSFNIMAAELHQSFDRQRKLFADLQENERMLATLMSNLPGMVYRCRNERGWSMIFVSEGSRELTGYDPEDIVDNRTIAYEELIFPEDRDMVWGSIQPALQEDIPFEVSYRIRTADGKRRWVWEKGRGIRGSNGEFLFLEGFITDVSELKLKDQLLIHAQKMEAIGTLAGGIAHDFNNILTALIGYAELAHEDLPLESPPRDYVEHVIEAGNRAKDLVRQILTFSRRIESSRVPVHMHLILKEVVKLLKASIPSTITIRQYIDPASGAILADPTQIHQVAMNLCTNAYQAMGEDGGELTITLVSLRPDARLLARHPQLRENEFIKLTVRDTGSGMDRQTMERIFDPFFTTKEKGTGLGLASVHGIVSDLNGIIDVESSPDEGTTVDVYLPRSPEAPLTELPLTGPPPTPKGNGEHLLIVDDDQAVLKMSEQMLTRFGYQVSAFDKPQEALGTFMDTPQTFDLLITDQIMPGMTGMQLIGEIRLLRPDLPVIITTGFSEKVTPESAAELGVKHFIQKPFTSHTIAEAVHDIFHPGD